jgi:hypothetical protein
MSIKHIFLIFLLAIFLGSCHTSVELVVNNIGVFDGGSIDRVIDNQSITGYSSTASATSFQCESHIIYIAELQENQFLGFNYSVRSFHRNHYKYLDRVDLKLLIRTPFLINSLGEVSTLQLQKLILLSDLETYNGYAFNESWEKMPGKWSFEFYFKDELIGIVHFDLRDKIPDNQEDRIHYSQLDVKAKYDGDPASLETYLKEETKKFSKTIPLGTAAQVLVGFVANVDGSLSEVTIIKGHRLDLNEEAIRIVNGIKNWVPAQIDGMPVRSAQAISIIFENR